MPYEPYMIYETVMMNFAVNETKSHELDRALAYSRFAEAAKKGAPVTMAGDQPAVIYPQFHILTADKPTRNMTLYTTEAHKGISKAKTGQYSFTKPYPIPLLAHHMSQPECGMPPSTEYGRIMSAKLVKNTENGQAHVAGLGEVTHPEGIDEIMTGRWLTGSLGSSVHDASCSICNTKFSSPGAMQDHVHQRGQFYRPRDKKKDSDKPVQHDYISGVEDLDWVQSAADEKGAQQCFTMINGYQAREYSKVHTPSDDQSIVTVPDTNLMPGSHFTRNGEPITKPEGEGSSKGGQEAEIPTTALWVPMSPSSRAGVSVLGERYIDLVTGREMKAQGNGFLFGHALQEHIERVVSGEDLAVLTESVGLANRIHIVPSTGLTVEGEQAPVTSESIIVPESVQDAAPDGMTVTSPTTTIVADEAALAETPPAPVEENFGVFSGGYCGPNETFLILNKTDVERGLKALPYAKSLTPVQKAKTRANLLTMAREHNWSLTKGS